MKNDFQAALLALALSGAGALGHQLLWTRRMTDLLGAGSQASARVIGCFFLGLALGAALAARLIPRITNRWRMAAVIELSSAVLCVPIMFLPSVSDWLWLAFGPERFGTWQVSVARLLISFAAVVPPAMAVGMSLPMILAAVRRSPVAPAARPILLYSVYTAGSALGLAFVVGVALQRFGALGAMAAMVTLNITAAGLCWYRSTQSEEPGPASTPVGRKPESPSGLAPLAWPVLLAAFFSGAGIVSVEVLSIELINLTAPLAFYPQSAILFSAVTLLAVAAAMSSRIMPKVRSVSRLVPWILSISGVLIAVIPLTLVYGIATRVALGYSNSIGGFIFQMVGTGFCVLGPPILVGGMLFPFLMVLASSEIHSRLAWLLSVNGIGGLVGAEVALRVLLPIQGVHVGLGLVGCLYAAVAILWVSSGARTGGGARLVLPLAALAACVLLIKGPLSDLRVFIEAPAFHVLDVTSSRDGSLAVVERDGMGRGMIFDNQYLLGASGGKPEMQRQAHIPLLLHPDPQRVAFLGLGTGITGSGALQHGPVESVTSVEISPLVAHAAEEYFSELNDGFCRNGKVRILVDDARTFILSAENRFDVIIGDLFTPWRPGESRLCSLEQFQAAKRALRPHGVFCQWFPMHQLTREQFEIIAATFRQVFPHTYVFRNHFKTLSVPVALVGLMDGRLSWDVVEARVRAEATRAMVQDPLCRHVGGIAMLCLGESTAGPPAGNNTLGNLRIELSAARNLILKGYDSFLSGESQQWADFVEGQIAQVSRDEVLPARLRQLPALGVLIGRYDAAFRQSDPAALQLRQAVLDALPPEIRGDTNANWSLWSGEAPMSPSPRIEGAK